MIPVLVLSHGNLAVELLEAARTIDHHLADNSDALPLPWDIDSDEATRTLKTRLRQLDAGHGVLVLTDMFGGTATNLALPFLKEDQVEVVTGVNLPMLVKMASLRHQELTLHEVALKLTQAGQKSIKVASELIADRSTA